MRIALAQYNPTVGDIPGNCARIEEMINEARSQHTDLVVFGELSVVGYPPRDLLAKEEFVAETEAAVEDMAARCRGISALVGYVRRNPEQQGRPLQNVAALLEEGRVKHVHVKTLLPTYDVFDETRYFEPGEKDPQCIEVADTRLGLSICEDMWDAEALGRAFYGTDPIETLDRQGADIIINMAASPFHVGKAAVREDLFSRQARRFGKPIVYVNQVGGNDELVFDGASCVVSGSGKIVGRARSFEEDLLIVDCDSADAGRCEEIEDEMRRLSCALKLGIGDYTRKCGFSSVVLGLSGGIDSAVVATVAADALGPENVFGLLMPSRYSSGHSVSDAEKLARSLGMPHKTVAIEDMHHAFERSVVKTFGDKLAGVAGENIQARIRGNLVMALSNAEGHLPLATGNKSELSVGYCTLYGDMCGGLAPIGDVLKTQVYALARQLNAEVGTDRIPENTIVKPPSAELKPDQVDQDSLPPYELLDEVLKRYIEDDHTARQIIADGFDADTVNRIVRMVDRNEYKRQQAAPVLKVSPRAFGSGRRMPIAQRYVQGE
ncbi:MAG: NAD+ synthase [Phycisphaerae bacterium]